MRGATGGHPISNTTTATTTVNVNATTGYSADTWHVGCLRPLGVRSLPFVPLLRRQFCNFRTDVRANPYTRSTSTIYSLFLS